MKNKVYTWWLYVLRLEEGKWYVGITSKTPQERFLQHKNGFMGARWTKRYKPIEISYIEDLGKLTLDQAQEREGKMTRMYMNAHGYNNVRRGDLTDDEEYIDRFNRYFTRSDWEVITIVTFLLLMNIATLIAYYLK